MKYTFVMSVMKLSGYQHIFPASFDFALERSSHRERQHKEDEADCIEELKQIICHNQAALREVEREAVRHHFALNQRQNEPHPKPLTFAQVHTIINVTKDRIRQIQRQAMSKLRVALEARIDGTGERLGRTPSWRDDSSGECV